MKTTHPLLLFAALLCLLPPSLIAQDATEVSPHQRLDELLTPEMKRAIAAQKQERRKEAERAGMQRQGADVIIIKAPSHPIAVAAIDENGEIIVAEY
jgi:hypothetical protein